jgi:hypothetical protein
VKRLEAPIRIIEITNTDVGAAADFSAAMLAERRSAGYAAAADQMSAELHDESTDEELGANVTH